MTVNFNNVSVTMIESKNIYSSVSFAVGTKIVVQKP